MRFITQATFLLALAVTSCANAAPSQAVWSFKAGGTAGAGISAEQGGAEVLRLGCRRGPAELFVLIPEGIPSTGELTIRLNDREIVLSAQEPSEAFTTKLRSEHIVELESLNRVELPRINFRLEGPEPDIALSLAGACQLALDEEEVPIADAGLHWFFSNESGRPHLGFGAMGSEFFGPVFRCLVPAQFVEIALSAPKNSPREIRLRSGDTETVIPAEVGPDILTGGSILTGRLPRDHRFWRELHRTKVVEVLDASGGAERFEAPATSGNIDGFLEACSG